MRRSVIACLMGLSLLLMGGVARADAPPQVVPVDVQIPSVNPCTGEEHTIFLTGELRIHQFYNEAGDMHHFNTIAVLDVETSDGFFGKDVEAQAHNGDGFFQPTEDEEWGMQMSILNAFARHPTTRQVIHAHFTLHLTYKNFEFIVDRETVNLECHGPTP